MPRSKRILVVDNVDYNRRLLKALVESLGYVAETAGDGLEAMSRLQEGFDLVLLDVLMPGLGGYEVVKLIRRSRALRDLPIVMVTALDSRGERLHSLEAGADDFLPKPIDKTELSVRLSSQLRLKDAKDALKRSKAELEKQVAERTRALRQALERTEQAHLDTIQRLVLVAEYKDRCTAEHLERIGGYGVVLAKAMELPSHDVEVLRHAIPMHDIGKIGIPDAILLKPGPLTPDEREVMKGHTVIGARILSGSPSELLQGGEIIALSHHEWWNGGGYPHGLAGDSIPLWGRICSLIDVFDALTSDRPYRPALPTTQALEMMTESRGEQFDPYLFDAFVGCFGAITALRESRRASTSASAA